MLCAVCLSMFQKESPCQGPHHTSIEHFEMAARSGCRICLTVQHDILPKIRKLDRKKVSRGWRFVYQQRHHSIYIKAANDAGQNSDWNLRKSFSLVYCPHIRQPKNHKDFQDLTAVDLLHQPWRVRHDDYWRNIPDNTGHSDVAKQALGWLKTCLKTHSACMCDLQAPMFYPKRLLDVSSDKCHLILTASERPCGQYATLSHCWGSTPFFHLSSSNEEDLRRRLPVEQLPRSFRDVILFTQRLGIRYLWIDSLCIQQEGPAHTEDWNEQAPLMHSVYSNGAVNISILHAQNPHIGAFKTRNPDILQPCYVSRGEYRIYEKMWAVVDFDTDHHNAITHSTLSKRGWVVQERMLSPRTIHFASDRIFWECRSSNLLPESYVSELGNMKGIQTGVGLSICKVPTSSRPQASEISDAWRRVIQYYAAAKLSKPEKDKLVAIAGIARYFGTFFNDQYVAGFFRYQLPSDLLWASLDTYDSLPPELAVETAGTTTYQGPTWSWVSTNSRIRFTLVDAAEMQVTVEKVDVQPIDQQNKYGQIRHAEITLCGVLLPCKLVNDRKRGSSPWRGTLEPFQDAEDDMSPLGFRDQKETDDSLAIRPDRKLRLSTQQNFMALPFLGKRGENHALNSRGLILQSTRTHGVYTRVGVFFGNVHIPQGYSHQTLRII